MAGNESTGGIGDNDEFRQQVRRALDTHFEEIEALKEAREQHETTMRRFALDLETNTTETREVKVGVEAIKRDTGEIVAWLKAIQGFRTVMGWAASGVKWLAALVVALAILYAVWRTGALPPPKV